MAKRQRRSERKVRDIMIQDVVSIEPAASLADAARVMDEATEKATAALSAASAERLG